MKNLTCKSCGSNNFLEKNNKYNCAYCGSSIIKEQKYSKKRYIVIFTLLSLATVGIYLGYNTVTSLKKDINHIYGNESFLEYIENTNSRFAKIVIRYRKLPGYKSFYIARDKHGAFAYGYESRKKTAKEANKIALEKCEIQRKRLGMKIKCELYTIKKDGKPLPVFVLGDVNQESI